MARISSHTLHLSGWILFILSAVFFMAAAWRQGDMLTFTGAVLFFLACFVFIVPLVSSAPRHHSARSAAEAETGSASGAICSCNTPTSTSGCSRQRR